MITNYPEGDGETLDAPYWPRDVGKEGSRPVPFSREILIERAGHAEASAFEALAELADAAKQRDEALARIRDLEAELGRQNPA